MQDNIRNENLSDRKKGGLGKLTQPQQNNKSRLTIVWWMVRNYQNDFNVYFISDLSPNYIQCKLALSCC
ncbi:hypothetical protein C0J52_26550 [Blattella germanica]|nr:hypothetical protein C0J52_26550 [Blattella germanica]